MAAKRTFPRTQNFLLSVQLAGDLVACFLGVNLGYWVRFFTPLRHFGVESQSPDYLTYLPLLAFGTLFLISSYAFLKLYDPRLLLRPHRAALIIMRGTFFWFFVFLSTSLIFKFEPPISRVFVAVSCIVTFVTIMFWRQIYFLWLSNHPLRERLMQRVAIVGWNAEAERLAEAVKTDQSHPYSIYGVITTPAESDPGRTFLGQSALGSLSDLAQILDNHLIDIVVVADLEMKRDDLLHIIGICEQKYVAFKVIPSFFQIFVSNLRMQTISGVPILGVERLQILSHPNQLLKRAVDIVGALVGLTLSLPIMAVLALFIRREGPGPILYRQERVGRDGDPFIIYKLRSMRIDAEHASGPAWAVPGDPRRLKIGAFMREWNLDELPQFWNVLIGDMSLVGPRPERPELIAQFERNIPHYNPRHEVRPGLTGWAQVNGLRGNTSLVERIRYDLYYIENWSIWFDVQIILLTFARRQNAY